jgi:hypothetical protein
MGIGVLSEEVKRPVREIKHSYPSNAEVKNEWRHTATPAMGLYSLHRENLTFTVHLTKLSLQHVVPDCPRNKTLQCEFDVGFSISVKMTNGNL